MLPRLFCAHWIRSPPFKVKLPSKNTVPVRPSVATLPLMPLQLQSSSPVDVLQTHVPEPMCVAKSIEPRLSSSVPLLSKRFAGGLPDEPVPQPCCGPGEALAYSCFSVVESKTGLVGVGEGSVG